jgi:hypothetical protein
LDKEYFMGLPAFPFELDPWQVTRTEMADYARRARDNGIGYIGACCGTVACHIPLMAEALGRIPASSAKSPDLTIAFRATGKSVPIFNDKHLSYNWHKAKRMVEISRELKFPLMAGSSIPVAYRPEAIDLEWGAKVRHAVSIFYADPDAYGFHNLERLQCMVERRRGGESGIEAVQYIEKDDMWNWVAQTPWAEKLLNAALARGVTRKQGDTCGCAGGDGRTRGFFRRIFTAKESRTGHPTPAISGPVSSVTTAIGGSSTTSEF